VENAINNQNPKPTINNDQDIFEGLKACGDLENLKIYYKQQYNNVIDKKGFAALKDELKGKMYV
jgi:hypothetical protein